MDKCNAIIKTGPRKGLKCNYKKKTFTYCNRHDKYNNDNNKEKQNKQNINMLPNEIISNIIINLEINDIIRLRLVNRFFLLMCNNVLNNYININNLLYAKKSYALGGGYLYVLCKILKINKKRIKIAPLKICFERLIREKSKYVQNFPIYETYEIKYDIELVKLNESFYVYKKIYDNSIIFESRKREYLGIDFKMWNKEILFKCVIYDF
jgi:hypothetical protein